MRDRDITLLQDSFARIAPIRDAAAQHFYADLFQTAPQVKPYFTETDMKEQGAKLMATLGMVVNGLRNIEKVVPAAQKLAIRHLDYGVTAKDYDYVGAALIRTLEKGLGDDFTPDVRAAWIGALTTLTTLMRDAAYPDNPAAARGGRGASGRKPLWKLLA